MYIIFERTCMFCNFKPILRRWTVKIADLSVKCCKKAGDWVG